MKRNTVSIINTENYGICGQRTAACIYTSQENSNSINHYPQRYRQITWLNTFFHRTGLSVQMLEPWLECSFCRMDSWNTGTRKWLDFTQCRHPAPQVCVPKQIKTSLLILSLDGREQPSHFAPPGGMNPQYPLNGKPGGPNQFCLS